MDGTSVLASHAHPNRASEASTPRHKNGKIKWQNKMAKKNLFQKVWLVLPNLGTLEHLMENNIKK